LIGLHCAHRGADLSYGRLEDGGLRCIYHGWLYDIHGRCLEQPGEPAGSTFHERISHTAYPCREFGSLIFAYLGPGEPPLLPNYEILQYPDEQRIIRKYYQDCNYLQANEGNFDPVHGSFLHRRFLESERLGMDPRNRPSDNNSVQGTDLTVNTLYNLDVSPRIELEDTEFGVRMYAIRDIGSGQRFVKVINFVMPNLCAVPGGSAIDGFNINWHVPIDDNHHWKYMITGRRSGPIDQAKARAEYEGMTTPDRRLQRNLGNRYLQDRAHMRTEWFSGMGPHFPVHDGYATETQGPIQDRTHEQLGYTDKGIIATRRMLLAAIRGMQAGQEPPHVIRDAASNEFPDLVPPSAVITQEEDWRSYWTRLQPVAAR
jgi:phenylpropionate dioxygenase-like ring-hydroxylating dioxygenase large terminal subunit